MLLIINENNNGLYENKSNAVQIRRYVKSSISELEANSWAMSGHLLRKSGREGVSGRGKVGMKSLTQSSN